MSVPAPSLPSNPLWGDNWPDIRAQWALDSGVRHFNHGAFGGVPRPVRQAQRALHDEIDSNPARFYRRELDGRLEAARHVAAEFCHADPGGFAWVKNVSEGMSVAVAALPLSSGDEIVVTDHRYPSVRLALDRRCALTGARQVEVRVPMTADDDHVAAVILSALTARTRAVVVDAVASHSGLVFPVRRLAASLERRGDVVLIVDAAHAPGALELDVDGLGAGIWVGNFHKWACAPHSAAGLWAAPHLRHALRPASVGFRDLLDYPQQFGRLGTDDLTGYLCVPAALEFLQSFGITRIREHNQLLARTGAELVGGALGSQLLAGTFSARHPVALPAGTVTDTESALALQTAIAVELRAEVSVTTGIAEAPGGILSLSAFVYNHPDEYRAFAADLAEWLPGHMAAV